MSADEQLAALDPNDVDLDPHRDAYALLLGLIDDDNPRLGAILEPYGFDRDQTWLVVSLMELAIEKRRSLPAFRRFVTMQAYAAAINAKLDPWTAE